MSGKVWKTSYRRSRKIKRSPPVRTPHPSGDDIRHRNRNGRMVPPKISSSLRSEMLRISSYGEGYEMTRRGKAEPLTAFCTAPSICLCADAVGL